MVEFFKSKIFRVTFVVLFAVAALCVGGYVFHLKISIKSHISEINEVYLNDYSTRKFVKIILRDYDFYNKKKLRSYIANNFDIFAKNNSDIYTFVHDYAILYDKSLGFLQELRRKNLITLGDVVELKGLLEDLDFVQAINKITYLNLKHNSNDALAAKEFLSGIVSELNFNYSSAEKFYLKAIELNSYQADYYGNLGDLYYKLYRFSDSINILERGLTASDSVGRADNIKKLKLLRSVARVYSIIGDEDRALYHYVNLLMSAMNIHDEQHKWLAVYNLALIEANYGDYNTSITHMEYAAKLATRSRNYIRLTKSLNALSKIRHDYGDYDKAAKDSVKAMKFAQKSRNLSLLAESVLNSCLNYRHLNNRELSDLYCNLAIKINDTLSGITRRPEYHLQNGNIYSLFATTENYQKALEYYHAALGLSDQLGLHLTKIESLVGISNCNAILGEDILALDNLSQSIKMKDTLMIHGDCSDCKMGFLYWQNKNYDRAIQYYENAMGYAMAKNNKLLTALPASHLASIYTALAQHDTALKYSDIALDAYRKTYRFDHHYILSEEQQRDNIIKNMEAAKEKVVNDKPKQNKAVK